VTATAESRRRKIVLVVDDSDESRRFTQTVVEAHGYSCLAVPSGPACLEAVNRAPPRVILLDVEMPSMDGYETCRRLRKLSFMRRVPIMFLTARKTGEAVRTGIGAGGNDFVVKPFDPAKLLERVDYWAGALLPG
jgi:CheY-like chemotaxis protein